MGKIKNDLIVADSPKIAASLGLSNNNLRVFKILFIILIIFLVGCHFNPNKIREKNVLTEKEKSILNDAIAECYIGFCGDYLLVEQRTGCFASCEFTTLERHGLVENDSLELYNLCLDKCRGEYP